MARLPSRGVRAERTRESVSSEGPGRRAATSLSPHVRHEEPAPDPDAPAEVLEFIRYCYLRRGIGWPELYDEMCAAAARGSYRGMDYDHLAQLGIRFSLGELPRLAALSGRVVAEERCARQAEARRDASARVTAPAVAAPAT
jgi:hypothetical protein